ncbi:septum site-determining protein MinC [Oscillatoria sp. CS-180]|uniref:septum site-determining protein MinC n=1 Tax=Oscillatoria sp. CS-180 TaxID=3021720 RepID=UPI00232EF46E|nr:septum site-determining protein MinC [Oscillatoria sp. CS-180]MDB9528865.1 septum site-determining protein MinC [Oscillatoria sp. CS-180]
MTRLTHPTLTSAMSLDSTSLNSNTAPSETATELPNSETDPTLQVRFKSQGGKLLLMLPPEPANGPAAIPWGEVWEQLKHRLSAGERFWQPQTVVYLLTRDRLVDARQLQEIADALALADLQLKRVYTRRRQTAVAAATAGYSVEQHTPVAHLNQPSPRSGTPLDEPLYLQSTIRSGVEIRHAGTVVILGDVNPGGQIVAEGDIVIWGRLKGLAHAGSKGNVDCRIMALHMQPTQLRIADKVARPPETPPAEYLPEVAYIGGSGIRIAPAQDFARWLAKH